MISLILVDKIYLNLDFLHYGSFFRFYLFYPEEIKFLKAYMLEIDWDEIIFFQSILGDIWCQ